MALDTKSDTKDIKDTKPAPQLGELETLPGQTEVVSGTVEHVQVLNSFPNATSYGPSVNVVLAPVEEEDAPDPPPDTLGGGSFSTPVHKPADTKTSTKAGS